MKADACTYVIYGATGNLSQIKLMPALYHLDAENLLPEGCKILAVGRRDWDHENMAICRPRMAGSQSQKWSG